ncbi:hypothetical protein ADIS_3757 [Lunatimonas lonarensis]|uniref:Uncharacterized protein n=1 Tax=Lunatimonas lonarensis TaxID=1232681 RepID=R7ZP23_9BACT|nr:hypothetical protein ADIS_3757 [Lunatimonas lonarensis]
MRLVRDVQWPMVFTAISLVIFIAIVYRLFRRIQSQPYKA